VEELTQWCLLKSLEAIDAAGRTETEQIRSQFDLETIVKRFQSVYEMESKASSSQQVGRAVPKLQVEVVEGPYIGKKWELQPRPKQPCFIGRSQGKKFRDKGISIPKDLEVSTTHGKFEVVGHSIYFTDTESTNGSYLREDDQVKPLEREKAYHIITGSVLIVGQTKMLLKVI
jgi:hypothetical protein